MLLLLLLLLILCRDGLGMIDSLTFTSNGPAGAVVTRSFGLARRGEILITYKVYENVGGQQVLLNADALARSHNYLLLVIVSENQRAGWYNAVDQPASQVASSMPTLCTQPSLARRQIHGVGNMSHVVGPSEQDDQYSVIILQCRKGQGGGGGGNPVMVDVNVVMRNARPSGNGWSYLSIDQVMSIRVLEGEMIVYALLIAGLCGQMLLARAYVQKIQFVFLGTMCVSALLVVVEYAQFYNQNTTGITAVSYIIAVNVVDHFNTVVSLLCLLLLSMGWSTVRMDGLSTKEIRLMGASMFIFFVVGLGGALCLDSGTDTCQSLYLVTYILKSLVLLGVIIAMNFTVTQLRANTMHSPWDPATPIQYARTRQFQTFRGEFMLVYLNRGVGHPSSFVVAHVHHTTHTHTHKHTHTYIHTHTYTHTHKHAVKA